MDRLSTLYRQFELIARAMDDVELADDIVSADSFSPISQEAEKGECGETKPGIATSRLVGSRECVPNRESLKNTAFVGICPKTERSFVVADIGADHGYLSKALLASGRCSRIIVTDIAEKPLARAKENIGVDSRVEYRLGDGLSQGDFSAVDMFFIAGMGGDEVVKILQHARDIKESAVFVLQPMTHFDRVVEELGERYAWTYFVNDKEKHYRVLVGGSFFQREHSCFVKVCLPALGDVVGSVEASLGEEEGFSGDPVQEGSSEKTFADGDVDSSGKCLEAAEHFVGNRSKERVSFEEQSVISYAEIPMVLDYSRDYAEKEDRVERALVENMAAARVFFEAISKGQSVVEDSMKQSASTAHGEGLFKRRRQIEAVRKMLAGFIETE